MNFKIDISRFTLIYFTRWKAQH